MAKFKFDANIGELGWLAAAYNTPTMEIISSSSTKIVVSDSDGDRVIFSGTGLMLESGTPMAGNVTKVQFLDSAGEKFLTITDANYKLVDIDITGVLSNFDFYEKGADIFTGSSVGDVLGFSSNLGNDKLYGLGGNDYLFGSDGKNLFDGGDGNKDVLTWEGALIVEGMNGVKVNLAKGTILNPWGKADTVVGIEDVRGTQLNDTFIGSKKNEFFSGQAGNDTYTGGKGKDEFEYGSGSGNDKITDFGNGDDSVIFYGLGVPDFKNLKGMMEQRGDDVVIDFANGNILTFIGVNKGDFTAADFTFL